MIHEDFYTGEPVDSGSPPSFQERKTEHEAAQMASFGAYDYDPSSRMMNMNMQTYQAPYTPYTPYTNMPNFGLGSPYRYTPNGNLAPTYGVYQPGANPAFFNQYNNPYMQQYHQPNIPTSYTIPGVNYGGEYMYPLDVQERIDDIQKDYFHKMQEEQARRDVDNRTSVYGYSGNYGYNYYGVPYYNPWQYNSINTELSREVDRLQNEARDNRLNFNLNISRLAHNIVGGADEEILKERYVGRTVPIPQHVIPTTDLEEIRRQNSLRNAEPFDNSYFYRQQFAKVSDEFHQFISPNSDLKEMSDNMSLLWANWEMEEEKHRRRNLTSMYDNTNNAYKYYIQRKAQERYCQEKGIAMPGITNIGAPGTNDPNISLQQQQNLLNQFPTLSSSVKLADDGTLNVVCNVGSNKGQVYSVVNGVNQNEDEYRAKKERFDRFLGSITNSIYQAKTYD